MADLAQQYLVRRANQGLATNTIKTDRTACAHFSRWRDRQRKSPKALTEADLEDYLYGDDGLASTLAASSFNTRVFALKGFLSWAAKRQAVNPAVVDAIRRLPVLKRDMLRLGLAQIIDMIETCDDEWERWVLVLASQTLARDSEIKSPRFADFNLQTSKLALYRHKTRDADEIRITPALADGYRRFLPWLQQQVGAPFRGDWFAIPRRDWYRDGWRYDPTVSRYNGCGEIVQRHAARIAGVDVVTLKYQGVHIIRRSMARALYDQLVEQNVPDPIRIVMAMLGHKSPQTTEIYLGLKADRERRNLLLASGDLLWTPSNDNVVPMIRRDASG